ncbi:hypothetical protein PVAND_012073 [Polypedilum vanderplanki]|uniref:BTB domain-containing protein n=1 Tax=Polypedilum vanderplanki TaxID=319348 RepID=A0A9J6CL88_POLVA|nr:hypothetical protein PVAND_012073 [Polypedilum vanderplanki]
MLPQQYCLRWKYHHSNLQTMFSQLLDRGCFCDVTLACDGQTLKAHRVVLSACSTYFDSILTNCNTEKDPIVILKDVKFMDIKYLVEFMYKGEINVEHNNLASLLKTAEELRIKGLAEVSWRDDESENGPESNDNNNNNVTDSNSSFPIQATNNNHQLNHQSSVAATLNQNQDGPSQTPLSSPKDLSARKKRGRPPLDDSNNFPRAPKYVHLINEQFYDHEHDKESAYDLSATAANTLNLAHSVNQLNRLCPTDDANKTRMPEAQDDIAGTSKKSIKDSSPPLPNHPFSNSSNLVTVMMDEKQSHHHDVEEHSFYMPMRRHENGHGSVEYDEDSPNHKLVPKIERSETPNDLADDDDHDNMMSNNNDHSLQSIFLTPEEREEWKDVIRMNDYLTKGRRPQFWEEPFTKKILHAIKNKNLEMKKAAKLLGVSYGTLYGRYRETYGCLKHPYRGPPGSYMVSSRMREMWPGDEPNDLLNLMQRNRMSMLQNDEINGANLMDMMNDEAMLEHLAPNLPKSFQRKIINNLDVANLLKQVQSSTNKSSPSSNHSVSPPPPPPLPLSMHVTASSNIPIPTPSTSSASNMLLTPVAAPSTSIESSSK